MPGGYLNDTAQYDSQPRPLAQTCERKDKSNLQTE